MTFYGGAYVLLDSEIGNNYDDLTDINTCQTFAHHQIAPNQFIARTDFVFEVSCSLPSNPITSVLSFNEKNTVLITRSFEGCIRLFQSCMNQLISFGVRVYRRVRGLSLLKLPLQKLPFSLKLEAFVTLL